ncbi:MAG: hypothetical protein JWM39_533 [Parcubacteria group bacterium]|nr:hypothetical protein [Parcubacteria group bacterium]
MTRFGWLVFIIVLLVIAGIIGGWYLIMRYHPPVAAVPSSTVSTSTQPDLSSSSIYTNGVYGFSLVYPAADTVAQTFAPWREGAIATGTPLVALVDIDGSVRVGASTSTKEVKACTKVGPAESTLADMNLGSTTFKAFTRDDMGTDNQQRITSYRSVHDGACVAIESFQTLQGGAVASSTSITNIVHSFSFARP